MNTKKILKIIFGVVIFLTLPSLLFFGFLYYKYNEELPIGITGEQADVLAYKMLDALNYEAYNNTNYIEWTFKNRYHFEWKKNQNICDVYWEENKVTLNLENNDLSEAYIHSFKSEGDVGEKLIKKAILKFNNASFWLVAPYKVFDEGVKRQLVKLPNNEEALLVTYISGDSYLWQFDHSGRPTSFKMWTSQLPIDGIEASWTDWITTDSGAELPIFHNLLFIGLKMGVVKGTS